MKLRVAWLAAVALAACTTPKPAPVHVEEVHHDAGHTGTVQQGLATWYGDEQQGGPTASGERFDKHQLTAAHRTLALGTRVRVTNLANGRTVEVRINDRGPYGHGKRIIDLSEAAARVLGMIDAGVVSVRVEVIK